MSGNLITPEEEQKRIETNAAFINALADRFPDIKTLLEQHLKDERGELMPMAFVLFDVTRYFVDLVHSGNPQSLRTAAAMLQFFEENYDFEKKSEAGVSGIIQISFMEAMWMEGLASPEIGAMMGPRLKKGWLYLEALTSKK
jgi:hypothetical protein